MKAAAKVGALYVNPQFVLFVMVSGGAALVNVAARLVFSLFLAYPQAVVCAFGVGMAVAFWLNKLYVFPGSTTTLSHNVVYFIAVNLLAFPFVLGVSWLLGGELLPPLIGVSPGETLGHAVAVALPAFSSFALHKFFTFRSDAPSGAGAGGERDG